jgi:hypothetical protein
MMQQHKEAQTKLLIPLASLEGPVYRQTGYYLN